MDFGEALKWMRDGGTVRRATWKLGHRIFIGQQPSGERTIVHATAPMYMFGELQDWTWSMPAHDALATDWESVSR